MVEHACQRARQSRRQRALRGREQQLQRRQVDKHLVRDVHPQECKLLQGWHLEEERHQVGEEEGVGPAGGGALEERGQGRLDGVRQTARDQGVRAVLSSAHLPLQ